MENKQKKHRLSDIISVAGLLVIIYGFALGLILTPDKDFSEEENRTLKAFPKFSLEALASGEFTGDITEYCSDQMPFRNLFVGIKAASEALLGKLENNDVLLGNNGYIIAKQDYTSFTQAEKNLSAVKAFAEKAGVPVSLAVAGRSQDVLEGFAPELYPADELSDKVFSKLGELSQGVDTIDIFTPLKARADVGEYVYYKTDHHYTTLGAYYAYREIMESFGIAPYELDYFTRETVSDEFYGTTWSKSGMKWTAPDTMEFFRYEGDDSLICEIVGGKTLDEGLYERSYLTKKDKYSAFIGGNNPYVKIYAPEESPLYGERQRLMLIKDSFGHALAPFLAAHFDLEIIDLRYFVPTVGNPSVSELIVETDTDRVLIVYNMDGILSDKNLPSIAWGE